MITAREDSSTLSAARVFNIETGREGRDGMFERLGGKGGRTRGDVAVVSGG